MGAGKKFGVGIRLVIMAVYYFLAVHYDADVQDAARIAVVSFADDGVDLRGRAEKGTGCDAVPLFLARTGGHAIFL